MLPPQRRVGHLAALDLLGGQAHDPRVAVAVFDRTIARAARYLVAGPKVLHVAHDSHDLDAHGAGIGATAASGA